MRRVAFLTYGDTSHLYSSMGLARRLIRRGYSVQYWGDTRIEPRVVDQGLEFERLDDLWPRYLEETRFPTNIFGLRILLHPRMVCEKFKARRERLKRLDAALDRFGNHLDGLLARTRPDFIVLDTFLL